MAETWDKKEREKKRRQKQKEKAEKKQERKEQSKNGNDLDGMLAYLDENGNLSSTPPDPRKKVTINAEDIDISVPKQRPFDPAELIHTGFVSFFNNEKGYGFIKDQKTQESVFVHFRSLKDPIKENNRVSFEIEMGPKGPSAVNVTLIK
jgi:cold shock CspA family protein